MFQNFNSTTSPKQGPPRLKRLRNWMSSKNIDGFIVPRADCHQGENVAECDERLSWLTGFTGSAGFACILKEHAGIFIDGRYRLQILDQVANVYSPIHWPEVQLHDWISETASEGDIIGFDPWLQTVQQINTLNEALKAKGIILKPCDNGIDTIWEDRPGKPSASAWSHPITLSGQSVKEKCSNISTIIANNGADSAVITLPDSLCWLLNIRGADVRRTPIVQAFLIITSKGSVKLFSDIRKFKNIHFDEWIELLDWSDFEGALQVSTGVMQIDPESLPYAAFKSLEAGSSKINYAPDPCILPKALKNHTELEGARLAHTRDGAAIVEFLSWFSQNDPSQLTEIDIVETLEGFRIATGKLHDISFDTISGSGPNGAIVHYRVTHETNRCLEQNSLLLIDSGGQYKDGTTDITRTLAVGKPSLEMCQCFTQVLQGMIAVSRVRFPKGLSGRDLDALARTRLWEVGQDYDHGTGHGVGSFLSVHEGPQRISRTAAVQLDPGMIISVEPGYYRAQAFGIRIENLVVVQEAEQLMHSGSHSMLDFETLTYAPIDRQLILQDMMTDYEIAWLNTYHSNVFEKLTPHLTPEASKWLKTATMAI